METKKSVSEEVFLLFLRGCHFNRDCEIVNLGQELILSGTSIHKVGGLPGVC